MQAMQAKNCFWKISTCFSEIKTLIVNKEKLLIDNFSMFPCLCVSMLIEILVEFEIESRLYFTDIYDDDYKYFLRRKVKQSYSRL